MAKKDTETIRSKQHRELDEVYSSRDPDLEVNVVRSVEEPKGNAKQKEITFEYKDGAYVVNADNVVLDREGHLRAAKAHSRLAQAVA